MGSLSNTAEEAALLAHLPDRISKKFKESLSSGAVELYETDSVCVLTDCGIDCELTCFYSDPGELPVKPLSRACQSGFTSSLPSATSRRLPRTCPTSSHTPSSTRSLILSNRKSSSAVSSITEPSCVVLARDP